MKYALAIACLIAAGCTRTKQEQPASRAEPARPVEYFKADPRTAGTIRGAVRFTGKKPPAKLVSMDAEADCQKLHDKPVYAGGVSTGTSGALADVFVYVKSGLEGKTFAPTEEAVVLDQRGCQYVPRVVALRAGQVLTVRNSDPVSHNIHPTPQNNRDWNQQQPPGAPDLRRKFAYPEVMIPVKCNVHNWMRSYIGVLDHPYFAVTNTNGSFDWTSVPPGEYTVAAWHEVLGEQTQQITLQPGATGNVTFTFRYPPEKE